MSKRNKLILIGLVLILAGCSKSQPVSLPTNTESPPVADTASPLPPQATDTVSSPPSATIQPTPEPTETPQEPTEPTPDLSVLLSGKVIPLLPAGSDLTVHEIHMITDQSGWGITRVDPYGDHILITNTGGSTWQDVTPPQPIPDPGQKMIAAAGFADESTAFVNYSGSEIVWTTSNGGITWQPSALDYQSLGGGMFSIYDKDHTWLFQFLDAGMQKVYTAIAKTADGGESWETILDPYGDATIQGFDKTGATFISPQDGWLTRDFRGVAVYLYLDITSDGGVTWQQLDMPAPPSDPDAFSTCACGLYDPTLENPQIGSARLTCQCYVGDDRLTKNYLYKTSDGGDSWEITYVPEGELHTISDQALYLTARDIYRSLDGGGEWDLVKSVNWDGQFSFVDQNQAWAVAYNPADDQYALVKTTDGCSSFQIIEPELITSPAIR